MRHRTICLCLVIVLLSSCSWTPRERLAAGVFIVTNAIDFCTTHRALDNGATELNPVFGKHPNDSQLTLYFGLSTIGILILTQLYPEYRENILWWGSGLNTILAINNERINNR